MPASLIGAISPAWPTLRCTGNIAAGSCSSPLGSPSSKRITPTMSQSRVMPASRSIGVFTLIRWPLECEITTGRVALTRSRWRTVMRSLPK
jgi:hypothetical protein